MLKELVCFVVFGFHKSTFHLARTYCNKLPILHLLGYCKNYPYEKHVCKVKSNEEQINKSKMRFHQQNQAVELASPFLNASQLGLHHSQLVSEPDRRIFQEKDNGE